MLTYPCPHCGASANLEQGCPTCRRPPDPDAAEVTRLDRVATELLGEVEAARQAVDTARIAHAGAVQRLNEVGVRRNLLATRVRAAQDAAISASSAAPAAPAEPAGPPAPAAPAAAPWPTRAAPAPETSPRTVQNLLFILGGLLLASAAVVFTAVAWSSFGVAGRAGVLAAVTLLTLLVPPVMQRRQLTATAETFAALGLLLVLLDGYAAWYVNLAGLADATTRTTYAGLVFAVTTVVAGGYAALTRLHGPRIAALAVAQPVLPLIAVDRGVGVAGWAALLTVQVAGNLFHTRLSGAVRWMAWVLAGLGTVAAAPIALEALAAADGVPELLPAAGVNLVLAGVIVLAGAFAGVRQLQVAAGVAVGVLGWVAMGVATEATPEHTWATYGIALVGIAGATLVLPARVRVGARAGALIVVGVTGVLLAAIAAVAALFTIGSAMPVWRSEPDPTRALFDWTVLAAMVLVAVALAVLVRRREVVVGAGLVLAFAIPGAFALPWWAPALMDGMVVVGLAALAAFVRRVWFVASGALVAAVHLVLVGLERPSSTLVALAGLLVLSTLVAVRSPVNRLNQLATAVGLLVAPGVAAAAARVLFGTAEVLTLPATLAGAVVGLALASSVVHATRWIPLVSVAGISLAGAGVTVAAVLTRGAPFGVVAAAALLCVVVGTLAARTRRRRVLALVSAPAVLPAVAALVAIAPAVVELLFRPYGWFGHIWTGAPTSVGLVPDAAGQLDVGPAFGAGPAAVTLGLLAVLAAIPAVLSRTGLPWSTLRWSSTPAALAALLGCAALDAPWPTVPVVSLATGLGVALVTALRPASVGPGAVLCWFAIGSGLAASLATRPTTLGALSAIVVVAIIRGVAGRSLLVRTSGWVTGAWASAWLAAAGASAADLALHWVAYWMLLPAALALATAAVLSGRSLEARALEAAAHATAFVALLVALGNLRNAAVVCFLWGLAVGLRALPRPDGRTVRATAAAGVQLLGYWLLLASNEVTLVEAYTAPAAVAALVVGGLAARRSGGLNSWVAYGPALIAGFAPSLSNVLVSEGEPWRRLALGGAALAVVVIGAQWRLRAPLVVGGLVLSAVAVHELVVYWDRLPRWAPLAAAGLLLVAVATTYERRLRDVNRLRGAVARMR